LNCHIPKKSFLKRSFLTFETRFPLQMGYEAGKGLGKASQGRTTIIEAHLRKGRGAIGAYGREGGAKKKEERVDSEEEEETEFKEKLHQWKKGKHGSSKVCDDHEC
jgi:hypothetical protein